MSRAEIGKDALRAGPGWLLNDGSGASRKGVVYAYEDRAVRIDNPQTLMDEGTISLTWLPDKGDLTVHKIEILRDGEVIDLLARRGLDVLRREQGLEQRMLDGERTATLAVPGLQASATCCATASATSTADQALEKEVQALQYLPSEPWQVGNARAIVSAGRRRPTFAGASRMRPRWPSPACATAIAISTVDLPLAEPARRAQRCAGALPAATPSCASGTFRRTGRNCRARWRRCSTKAAQESRPTATWPGRPSDHAARPIRSSARCSRCGWCRTRSATCSTASTGGNYIPQARRFTWEKRYGDCKAKTMLLTALLRAHGHRGRRRRWWSASGGDGAEPAAGAGRRSTM